jgi:uncharacterized surface protein with fasciclin (FAS1) repeats
MRALTCLAIAACLSITGFGRTASAQTITDIVASSGGEFDNNRRDYDILLTAVLAADLAETLATPDLGYTVFAPNDAAFFRLAKDLGYVGPYDEEASWLFIAGVLADLDPNGNGDPIPVLTDVLLYHVAPTELDVFDVIIASFFRIPVQTALEGATFQPRFFTLQDNDPDFRDPFLFFPLNVQADNGIVHTIGRVLIPADL